MNRLTVDQKREISARSAEAIHGPSQLSWRADVSKQLNVRRSHGIAIELAGNPCLRADPNVSEGQPANTIADGRFDPEVDTTVCDDQRAGSGPATLETVPSNLAGPVATTGLTRITVDVGVVGNVCLSQPDANIPAATNKRAGSHR